MRLTSWDSAFPAKINMSVVAPHHSCSSSTNLVHKHHTSNPIAMLLLGHVLCLSLFTSAAFLDNSTVTIVSDVDDILRVTEVWNVRRAMQNVFADPFEPPNGMPELYRDYAQVNGTRFAYITDALASWSESYVLGIPEYYPVGEIGIRNFHFGHIRRFFNSRQTSIQKLLDRDTNQKFILVGDFATPGLSDAYARLALKNPRQVQCLFMLDVRATNPANLFVPATKLLSDKKLADRWIVFETAAEFSQESLAYLRRLNDTADENFGCDSLLSRQKAFLDLLHNKHINNLGATMKTVMNIMVTQMQCLMLSPWRPSPQCRYDRREGTWYPRHKKFESQGQLQDWKNIPDTVVNGTKYDRMCHEHGKFYLVNGTCPKFGSR